MRFLDTGVLLYALSRDPAEATAADHARGFLERKDVVLSMGVLEEFAVEATRASRTTRLRDDQVSRFVTALTRFPVVPTTPQLLRVAVAAATRFGLSLRDATVIESARSVGCEIVVSSDIDDRREYAGVRVLALRDAR